MGEFTLKQAPHCFSRLQGLEEEEVDMGRRWKISQVDSDRKEEERDKCTG